MMSSSNTPTSVFQCPYGHSLFFHVYAFARLTSPEGQYSFNALTGILCFSTRYLVGAHIEDDLFQCPDGHSLFFHGTMTTYEKVNAGVVSMP